MDHPHGGARARARSPGRPAVPLPVRLRTGRGQQARFSRGDAPGTVDGMTTIPMTPPPAQAAAPRRRGVRATVLFLVAVALIALHVLDDNFLQPAAGHVGRRPPRQRARPARPARRSPPGPFHACAAGAGRPGARRSACSASPAAIEGCPLHAQGRPERRRLHQPAGFPAGAAAVRPRRRHVVAHAAHGRPPARRYTPSRRCSRVAGFVGSLIVVCAVGIGYVTTHVGRAVVPPDRLGVAARGRALHDQRRPGARGLVHPVAQRRRGDRVPGPQRPAEAGPHARAPRLRRAALRPPRRGPQRGRPERVGLGRRPRTSRPRSPTCSGVPTSTRTASAASASPSAAR